MYSDNITEKSYITFATRKTIPSVHIEEQENIYSLFHELLYNICKTFPDLFCFILIFTIYKVSWK